MMDISKPPPRFYGVDQSARRPIDIPMCSRLCPCARCQAQRLANDARP